MSWRIRSMKGKEKRECRLQRGWHVVKRPGEFPSTGLCPGCGKGGPCQGRKMTRKEKCLLIFIGKLLSKIKRQMIFYK